MKTHDPVLALIAIAVLTIEAAWILLRAVLVPVVALLLTLASDWIKDFAESPEDGLPAFPPGFEPPIKGWADDFIESPEDGLPIIPSGFEPPIYNVWKQQAKPTPHPLATIATELELLPVTALRQMAGIRSKAIRKSELVAMVAACS